jgi:hypothetical protein
MHEIICPQCHKDFKIDEAGYADILKQVRDGAFEQQLHERLELAEQDKRNAVELAQVQVASEMQKSAVAKDSEIQVLKAKLDATELAQKLAITEAVNRVKLERDELKNGLRGTAKRSSGKLAPRMHYVDHLDASSCDLVIDDVVGVSHKFSQARHALA